MLTRSLLLAAACGTAAAQAVDAPTTPPSPIQSLWLGDLNADGRDDAFVVQPDGSTRLLINSGDGSFEDVTARAGLGDAKGAHMALFPKTVSLIKEKTDKNILFLGGGIIPEKDIPRLKEAGITEVFGPGTSIAAIGEVIKNYVK